MQSLEEAFVVACGLDVLVPKPGNVSVRSPGHGMTAVQFVASASAAAPAMCTPGARVGQRIEAAVAASWAAVGCNTNLGIVLLCAPIALAFERFPQAKAAVSLQRAIEAVLADLDRDDAAAAYRAIAMARPGGLGQAPAEDVRQPPTLGLRDAMALAADRDSIARQYANGFADLFDLALPTLRPGGSRLYDAVQRIDLELLCRWPDSHIVRKHGEAVAQTVMSAAQRWRERSRAGVALEQMPGFAAWDGELKAAGINPGTTADLTVAALLLAAILCGTVSPVQSCG
jgi:triphosphoribosyl-dephospho-CoA synthase